VKKIPELLLLVFK